MRQTSIDVGKDLVELLGQRLLLEPSCESLPKSTEHEAFRCRCSGSLIVGYNSGKVVIEDERGKKLVYEFLMKVRNEAETGIVIGSDEAGKGEWLGPLVVCAVALTPAQSTKLRSEGVKDSKDLSIGGIQRLVRPITEISVANEIVVVSPKRLNTFMGELRGEGKNLNELLAWAHAKALETLYERLKGKYEHPRIVIDEFDRIKTQSRLGRVLDYLKVEVIQKPRAEEEMAVAAASVLAKARYESWLQTEGKRRGLELSHLNVEAVLQRSDANELAKLFFVRHGSSARDGE